MLAAAGPADDSVFYYPKAQPKGRKRKKYIYSTSDPPKSPPALVPLQTRRPSQTERRTNQGRRVTPRYPGRWETALSEPRGGFSDGRPLFSHSLILSFLHPPKEKKKKKKGCKKKKPTHLAPRPVRRTTTPSTLSDCWPIRLLSSGPTQLKLIDLADKKTASRAVRLSSGGFVFRPCRGQG